MEKISGKFEFVVYGVLTSLVSFFLFVLVLFILKFHNTGWGTNSDILSILCGLISTFFIVWTALLAYKSFWFTDRKDKIERTLYYIRSLATEETTKNLYFVSHQLQIELLKKEMNLDEINKRIHHILRILEEVGMLLKRDYIDIDLLYDWFSISLKQVMPNLIFILDKARVRGMEDEAWSNVRYLKNRFDSYK